MQSRSKKRSEIGGVARRQILGIITCLPWLLISCGRNDNAFSGLEGRVLPSIVLPDLSGKSVTIVDVPGFPLLLNFWATWCPPCRAEMGSLDRLHKEFVASGFSVLGVSVDEDINLVREFLIQERLGFPVLSDPKGRVAVSLLGSGAVPVSVLIGRDGVIRRVVPGEHQWDEAPARDWVKELLA